MAVLTLDRVWLNRWDTGQAVSSGAGPGRTREVTMAGEVRSYAGGRQRAFTSAGVRGEYRVTLRQVTLSTVELLESWIGLPVQVRDPRGQRHLGVFFEVPVAEDERPKAGRFDVALALRRITVVDGV